ncbi:2OG-Fe(II) oxygenase [Novosphingopyxis sp.]|uniref:2OG-Fe(II) oxygenase n=1 Tax=Novosphingopyxis sp. TaxID=2709690 RepID=UPI003B5BD19F
MSTVERASDLAVRGRASEAFWLLSAAAGRGDAEAAFRLAEWRMAGDCIRRDMAEARKLFGRAAELGLHRAEAPYVALLANGAGNIGRRWNEALERLRLRCEREPEACAQLALLEKMELDAAGDPRGIATAEIACIEPDVRRIAGFLTIEECDYLSSLALPLLRPAVVVHPETGKFVQDPIRTSMAAAFPFVSENPVLHAVNRRIAAATGTGYEQGEPLQLLSYAAGQEYKLHSDALPGSGNQRIKTMLVYLNDAFEGGETFFPKPGMSIRGKPGEAVLFSNADAQGRPDPAAIHAGLPVRQGRKLILSKWIRARPLDLTGPPGRPC